MARRSTLMAAKYMPGAASPTSAPQNAGAPYYGLVSPLAQQLANERGYSNSYGPFLPRPAQTFTEGAFGPFSPILPVPVDAPPVEDGLPDPRLFEYQVGWNLPVGQPGTEGLKLVDFATLRTLGDLYSVARACIEKRKNEITGLDWDIVPTHEASKAYQGDRKANRDLGERIAKAKKFFRQPDPDYFSFGEFLTAVLEMVFVYDALSIVLRPKRGKGMGKGLLGSDLDCLELVDGATIRPLLGMHGEIPRPPCYSEDTEILTRGGWKLFSDLKGTEEVATRSKDGVFEWQRPTHYVNEAYTGPMVQFSGRTIDCLVTPDHRMLTTVGPDGWSEASRVRDSKGRICGHADGKDGTQREWITSAQRLLERKQAGAKKDDRLVAVSSWHGRELRSATFTVTGQVFRWDDGDVHRAEGPEIPADVRDHSVEMTGDQYAAFMGMYLSEGGLIHDREKHGYRITISQTANGKGIAEYGQLIQELFGDLRRGSGGWNIWRKALWRYCHQFGYAPDKFAPPEVLDMSRRQLKIFWRYYWLGDGHTEHTQEQEVVATSSCLMAGAFQEIIQKLGYSSSARPSGDGYYRLRTRKTAYPGYNAKQADYSGRVYCVTVPNGIVYVRRNGRAVWSGNSPAYQQYLYGVPRSDYMTMITQRDIDEGGLAGSEIQSFTSDQLLYLRTTPRRWTPYGFANLEQSLIPVLTGLQKQAYQLDYFREGCYSPDTEILTKDGWKLFPDLTYDDELATRSEQGDFRWHRPEAILSYDFDGELLAFQSKAVDQLVTPGHRMIVQHLPSYVRDHPATPEHGWHVRLAKYFAEHPSAQFQMPATSRWTGPEPEYQEIDTWRKVKRQYGTEKAITWLREHLVPGEWAPSAQVLKSAQAAGVGRNSLERAKDVLGIQSRRVGSTRSGRGVSFWEMRLPAEDLAVLERAEEIRTGSRRIPMKEFCGLLGLYISEGWVRSDRNDVLIAQHADNPRIERIREILDSTGLHWSYQESNQRFAVCSKDLARWLRDNCPGRAWEKRIPVRFKNLGPECLAALMEGLTLGDAHLGPAGQRYYTTTSPGLADDVQEIFQKLGCDAWIRQTKMEKYFSGEYGETPYGGHARRQMYVVRERMQDAHMVPAPVPVSYTGKVWCVTVPGGVVYVRRNGRAIWCGNTIPGIYISPGDPNMTPNQIRELQDALNAIAGDPAWHHKVIVLPPGSKTEPQRPVDLADQFDEILMTEVCMNFDINPMDLGIVPKVSTAVSPFAAREMAQASKTVHERTATKPLLKFLCNIFDSILHRVCGQDDMKFTFEGLSETQDEASMTDLIVKQVQYGIRSVDEGRAELELPPWNLPETSGPVVFTQMGPVAFEQAQQLLQAQAAPQQGSDTSHNGPKKATSTSGRGDQYGGPGRPRHSTPFPAPQSTKPSSDVPPERAGRGTPAHDAARAGMGVTAHAAAKAELGALTRHLKKGRQISTWEARHIPGATLAAISEDLAKGLSVEQAVDIAALIMLGEDVVLPKAEMRQWPGWQRDLGLVGAYTEIIRHAFRTAENEDMQLRRDQARGVVTVTPGVFRDMTGQILRDAVSGALAPLVRDAWKLGYESAQELAGAYPHEMPGVMDAFLATELRHWSEQIGRTGLGNASQRAELIARTEISRAQSAAALQCYRDSGVAYKHLLTAPDDVCPACQGDAADGDIPLDAAFGSGNLGPPLHPACRCAVAPAGIEAEPPLAHLGKAEQDAPAETVAFLLIRALNVEGKWRYLLQKRGESSSNPGEWGLPGGTAHPDETPWATAMRESEEEMGALPGLAPGQVICDMLDDRRQRFTFVCETAWFEPSMDGSTPEEVAGWGWFRPREIAELDLHPAFEQTWELFRDAEKDRSRSRVLVNGQEIYPEDNEEEDDWPPGGGGGTYPHPHRADGTEVFALGGRPGTEPPRWDGDETEPFVALPAGPAGAHGVREGRAALPPAGGTSPHVADGSVKKPRPADNGPDEDDDAWWPLVRGRPPNAVGKGASDYWDPNPVEPEHVLSVMRSNFPEDVLSWVKRAHWIGPVEVPWERVNTKDADSWAASHQRDAVHRFARQIKAGTGHLNPSILVQRPDDDKCDIVDGHHRALARHQLGKPVLAYVGFVHAGDMQAALETHSSQFHSGSNPQNKGET
jgi:8-oxo-dGTP pyrophosphatase MutT (NUDIX family)